VNSDDLVLATTMGLIIVAGAVLMITAMIGRRKVREMEHRERLAMIERGLMPSPESDPGGFETAARLAPPDREPGDRYRTAGVLMIGLGLGLMFLIGFSGNASVGFGIGGAWAVVGAASLLNYFLIARRDEMRGRRQTWSPPIPKRPGPPPDVGP